MSFSVPFPNLTLTHAAEGSSGLLDLPQAEHRTAAGWHGLALILGLAFLPHLPVYDCHFILFPAVAFLAKYYIEPHEIATFVGQVLSNVGNFICFNFTLAALLSPLLFLRDGDETLEKPEQPPTAGLGMGLDPKLNWNAGSRCF